MSHISDQHIFTIDELVHGNPMQAARLAYAAGIIDGEGTIRINKTIPKKAGDSSDRISPAYDGQICCGMTDRRVLDFLSSMLGGRVREERVPGRLSVWRWAVTGRKNIMKVLDQIQPYLLVKQANAIVLRDLNENWKTPWSRQKGVDTEELQRREELYQKMRELNAVGAAATTKQKSSREVEAIV